MTRDVQMTFQTYEHIVTRRARAESWHVEFVLGRIRGVVDDPSL